MRKMLPVLSWIVLAGCDDRPDSWTAWVYEDRDDLSQSETLTGFNTFEQCQSAAIQQLRTYDNPSGGDYECGYKCRWDGGTNVCKETRK